ncbi:MAG: 50S ribosomal protein L9 [Patescibacteria group bacterium]
MKIILQKDVPNVGQIGKVIEVKFGFGKNWLIPQGLAILATTSLLKQIEDKQNKFKKEHEETLKQWNLNIEKLKKSALVIKAKVTEKDNLYSHITAKNIKDELKKQCKIEISEKQIKIPNEIKHIGEHKAIIELTPELTQELNVKIEAIKNKTKDKKISVKKPTIRKKTVKKTIKKE